MFDAQMISIIDDRSKTAQERADLLNAYLRDLSVQRLAQLKLNRPDPIINLNA